MYDFIIKNVRIIDGTSAPWFRGSVAVKDGKIAEIGPAHGKLMQDAAEVVDGQDLYLAPGFIDMHSHSDTALPKYPLAESRILQGVTTEIGGNCGISAAPVSMNADRKKQLKDYVGDLDYTWNTVGEYLDAMEAKGISTNLGMVTGHGTVRIAAMGFENRKADEEEMQTMRNLLRQSLEDGAFGMSSGLIYPPGCFADTDELAELCEELVPYGAYYATHMRNENTEIVEALNEALEIGRRSGAAVQISHHKVTRKSVWRLHIKTTIAMIDKARREGMDVQVDQYPYRATSTSLDSNAPEWAFEGGVDALIARLLDPKTRKVINQYANDTHVGRWQDVYVASVASEKNQWTVGKSILEIAQIRGVDPADACFDLVVEEKCRVSEVVFGMCEDDIEYVMQQPYTMIGSDGEAAPLDYVGQPHPRWFGTFPRVIAHYCRDRQLFPLETAIFKMTGLTASRLGLQNRGLIKEGNWADLVLFDFDKLQDNPDFAEPKQACSGIRRVYVNGVLTALDGAHTGARAGMAIRKGR